MAHAHDRTLIASLGFGDPDKRDSLHDAACQYLALQENHAKLVGLVVDARIGPRPRPSVSWSHPTLGQGVGEQYAEIDFGAPRLEQVISKGQGQYKTHIGFLDVVLPTTIRYLESGRYRAQVSLGTHGLSDAQWTGTIEPWQAQCVRALLSAQDKRLPEIRDFMVKRDVTRRFFDESHACRAAYESARIAVESRWQQANPGTPFGSYDQLAALDPPYKAARDADRQMEARVKAAVEEEMAARTRRRAELMAELMPTTGNYSYKVHEDDCGIIVEAKIGAVPVGDLVRQIKLYREYVGRAHWFAATLYQLRQSDVDLLRAEGIAHVQLGERFLAWAREQDGRLSAAAEL